MLDIDVCGTILEAIANDLRAMAGYLLNDRKDGNEAKLQKTVLHVTAARDMLTDLLDDIEEEANDLDGIPYVEVGYADGSKARITGCFGIDTVADVARLIQRDGAEGSPVA